MKSESAQNRNNSLNNIETVDFSNTKQRLNRYESI